MHYCSTFLLYRCYWGAERGEQAAAFTIALNRVGRHFATRGIDLQVESMELIQLKRLSPSDFVDWLLGAHLHFILTHIHQGLSCCRWSMTELYNQVGRLKYHPGFPSMEKLWCPIFRQDKMAYLRLLSKACTLPTCELPLLECVDLDDILVAITR